MPGLPSRLRDASLLALLKAAAAKWNQHDAPRLGAALAYYTLLSLAPLLVLMVSIYGLFISRTAAESQLLAEAQDLAGYSEAATLKVFLDSTHHTGAGIFSAVVAAATLLFGASGVFVELRDSLNRIWETPPRRQSTVQSLLVPRLISFGMVLGLGVLLFASLLLTGAITTIGGRFLSGPLSPERAVITETVNIGGSLVLLSVIFALTFKFVPRARIAWADVAVGAVVTAFLFEIGKALLAIYIAKAGVGSAYGAAGSVIALVVWVYYSAQIFFFGAVFTRVWAERRRFLAKSTQTELK